MTSKRKHLLVFGARSSDPPTVTVENYCKWYALQVVDAAGDIKEYDFGELEPFAQDYVSDHVPNPLAVVRWATAKGWRVDPQSLEMMVGRWAMEVQRTHLEALLAAIDDALDADV